jgi:hypothetical protein
VDLAGHLRPHAGCLLQRFRIGVEQRVDRPELLREVAAGDVTDLLDADREQDAAEGLGRL